MLKVLVTGGCGFIGSNFIRLALEKHKDWQITNFDLLTYSGNLNNLADVEGNSRYNLVRGDICDPNAAVKLVQGADIIFHFAAESHVDRSIEDPEWFIRTNILGTHVLLNAVRKTGNKARFVHISTDEVYGSIPSSIRANEACPLNPSSPYAASKAASDLLALSFHRTFGTDVVITRSTNNYGPFQHPEKMIPLFITNLLDNQDIPLYDDGSQIRDWLHVLDNCEAILQLGQTGFPGEIYNIGACQTPEWTNLDLTHTLLELLEKPEKKIKQVAGIRPGHDQRYAVSTRKISKDTTWKPKIPLEAGLRQTVQWYVDNKVWWLPLKSSS